MDRPVGVGQGGGDENLSVGHVNLGGGAGTGTATVRLLSRSGGRKRNGEVRAAWIDLVGFEVLEDNSTSQTPGSGVWFAVPPLNARRSTLPA